jgi:spore germination cell wall hydrolase CwlJ-like protein
MAFTTKTVAYILGAIFALLLVKTATDYKFSSLDQNTYVETRTMAQVKTDLECMALNIYREAGNEPVEGRIAVAQVTMNRVAHPDFPNTVCGVVYQKSVIMSRVVCQFSWYCDSSHKNRPINQASYQESMEVAKKVILENFRLEGLNDALFYHADYVNPNWRLDRIQKIGAHIFYKQKGKDHAKVSGN